MKFEKFEPLKSFKYASGWDKFALEYAQLANPLAVYSLTKKLMYEIIDKNIQLNENSHVLDIGCGTGNDFPFFLSKKTHITGFDMSDGMLNKAYENYAELVESGQINLLKGKVQEFESNSIGQEKFDLIFSVSGGLAYIDNTELERTFMLFKELLKPGGKLITAHFNKVCLMEDLYNLCRLKFNKLNHRNNDQLQVNIKNENMTMYLRTVKELLEIAGDHRQLKWYPLLALTPPYQTGYKPGKILFKIHQMLEHKCINNRLLSKIADQFVMVFSND